MSAARATQAVAQGESGAVLVLVALMLPVLIGVGGLVVDVGNWFAHKRHLQVQADAGALAAAGRFRVPCTDATIRTEAARYSSVEYAGGPGYNPLLAAPAGTLHRRINSKRFYGDRPPDDDTVAGEPCAAKMIDVKLTETGLPWFMRLAGVPFIDAHARVEIHRKTTGAGALPIGVPEVGPTRARALFVDEADGSVLATTDLVRTGTSNGLAIWSNGAAPVAVTVKSADIGVRIVLSGSASTTCGDALVTCFGAGTNTAITAGSPGLAHLRGYAATPAGTTTAPQVRDARLFGGTCEDGYFTASATYPCTVNVGAVVDFGGTLPATSRVLAKKTGANNNTAVELTAPATPAAQWTGGGLSIAATPTTSSVDLMWRTGCPTDRSANCNTALTTLGAVQRTFAASEALDVSGPIKLLRLSEAGVPGANSFSRCATCTHDLVVTLGLKPNLQSAQSTADPVVSLKLAGGGSQNQALDCDPSQPNLRDQLANGCTVTYAVNEGQSCASKAALWNSAQPWKCVVISTGAAVGQVGQGMSKRILGATNASVCTAPNNWSRFPDIPPGDPRVVSVFRTPFGAFSGSGGETVPVTGFATFYVTGWDNGACQGQGDDAAGQGAIVGHYIKYIDTINTGEQGGEFCDFTSLSTCVAVFTR